MELKLHSLLTEQYHQYTHNFKTCSLDNKFDRKRSLLQKLKIISMLSNLWYYKLSLWSRFLMCDLYHNEMLLQIIVLSLNFWMIKRESNTFGWRGERTRTDFGFMTSYTNCSCSQCLIKWHELFCGLLSYLVLFLKERHEILSQYCLLFRNSCYHNIFFVITS